MRQTEQLAKLEAAAPGAAAPQPTTKDADTLALERDLGNLLGLSVEIKLRRKGGALVLNYTSLEQLDDILHRLSHGRHGGRPGDRSGDGMDLADRGWSEAGETHSLAEMNRDAKDQQSEP